jgi:hypothetical protein
MEVSTRAVIPFKMTPSRKRLISWADGFRGLRIGDVTALNGNVPAIKSGKYLPLFDHHTTKSLFFPYFHGRYQSQWWEKSQTPQTLHKHLLCYPYSTQWAGL